MPYFAGLCSQCYFSIAGMAFFFNIMFEDTGIGISEEDLPKMFERFYRCDRSRSLGGIGLGLSLAKAIANAFGGSIRVKSTKNKGSSFLVALPN